MWISENWVTLLVVVGLLAVLYGAAWFLGYWAGPSILAPPVPQFQPGDGAAFEKYVAQLLAHRGYRVTMTPKAGDYGVGLIAVGGGTKIAVQVKNYSKPVGVRAVQEVNTGRRYYGALDAWVVSRSGFTKQAKTLAAATGVQLVDVNRL